MERVAGNGLIGSGDDGDAGSVQSFYYCEKQLVTAIHKCRSRRRRGWRVHGLTQLRWQVIDSRLELVHRLFFEHHLVECNGGVEDRVMLLHCLDELFCIRAI